MHPRPFSPFAPFIRAHSRNSRALLLFAFATLFALFAAPAQAQTAKSRSALYTEIDTNLPSTTGAITAAVLRAQLKNVVASAYNTVNADAQPIDADLTALAALSGTNTIYYRSAANTWSAVTIGTNLTFSAGTLSASGGGSSTWGDITGTLSSQTDLQAALDLKATVSALTAGLAAKADSSHTHTLSQILQSSATTNQVPQWNGTAWVPVTLSSGGSVTSVSVVTANGVSASVANATTTPAITFTLGAITPTSVNGVTLSGSATPTLAVTGTAAVSGTNTGDQTTITGNAGSATILQATRTIGGSSFNGSANVTSFPAPGAIGGTTPSTGAFTTLSSTGLATLNSLALSATSPVTVVSNGKLGVNAGGATTATSVSAVGHNAMSNALSTALQNTAVGYQALRGTAATFSGTSNNAFGVEALYTLTTGTSNTALAKWALYSLTSGGSNVAVGEGAGYYATTGSRNIMLGAFAGAFSAASDEFYLDNQLRADNATEKTNALLYGVMAATPAGQFLRVNGVLEVTGVTRVPFTAMPALAVNVALPGNTYSATGAATFTYSNATPTAGTSTLLRITADGTDRTITIPSTYSLARGANITSLLVPASTTLQVKLQYLSSRWEIIGDPVDSTGTGAFVRASALNPAVVALGAGTTIDWSAGNTFSATISGSTSFSFSNTSEKTIVFALTNGATGSVTFSGVTWAGGTAPTPTASKTDVYTFIKVGSAIYGNAVTNF